MLYARVSERVDRPRDESRNKKINKRNVLRLKSKHIRLILSTLMIIAPSRMTVKNLKRPSTLIMDHSYRLKSSCRDAETACERSILLCRAPSVPSRICHGEIRGRNDVTPSDITKVSVGSDQSKRGIGPIKPREVIRCAPVTRS